MQPCEPEAVRWDMQQVQLAIARRAFELFETRNREHGHDWEDWFQAESELLCPVSIAVSEAGDRFIIRAILWMIDVSWEIDPAGAAAEPQAGIFKFELPIVAKQAEKAAAAGKA